MSATSRREAAALVNQRPETDGLQDGSALAFGRTLEGSRLDRKEVPSGGTRGLGHGDDALTEVERSICGEYMVDVDVFGARRKGPGDVEEGEL